MFLEVFKADKFSNWTFKFLLYIFFIFLKISKKTTTYLNEYLFRLNRRVLKKKLNTTVLNKLLRCVLMIKKAKNPLMERFLK